MEFSDMGSANEREDYQRLNDYKFISSTPSKNGWRHGNILSTEIIPNLRSKISKDIKIEIKFDYWVIYCDSAFAIYLCKTTLIKKKKCISFI